MLQPADAQTSANSASKPIVKPDANAAANALQPGQLLDPVACAADPEETYALYLPSTYTTAKQWPIIYIFDPAARGSVPVKMYKDAAEKYGYILAASNNSRNFQGSEVSRTATALWRDTHTRLALDARRIYMMGFSGGARVATELAMRCEQCAVAGVIAQGAGYPSPPQPNERFSYFSFIADRDFNWPEIMELRRKKEEMDAPYRLRVFAGEHDWAPAQIFPEALEWLQLKAMQAAVTPRNAEFIDQQFARMQKEADDARQRKDVIAEFDAYRAMASDFKGLKDVTASAAKLAAMKNSSELKQALKKQQDAIDRQNALMQPISSSLARVGDADLPEQMSLRSTITDGMRDLTQKADHAKSEEDRAIFLRAFKGLWVQTIEAGQAQLQNGKNLALAEFYFQLISDVSPDEAWPRLLLAETSAARGDKKRAIKELREAVKRGLKNPATLEKDTHLQALGDDLEYQQIVAELKAKRDAPVPQSDH